MEINTKSIQIKIHAPISHEIQQILTPDALRFVGYLCHQFEERRQLLLAARKAKAVAYDAGEVPHFISNHVEGDWKCASIPQDVQDRRVEITGPVDRKMVINGLNSGANVYMADFEDSTSPTWKNITEGQVNLHHAVQGSISYTHPKTGKVYTLNSKTSVLFVRPRGWHLDEGHVTVNGKVASASIFDFGLYFFHNVHALLKKGSGPYFYLPKLESHQEARLWNDIFIAAQQYISCPIGTIRATVLLETITAAFEMEQILYELRNHSLGLNCGRWDYLFSYIKKFKYHVDKIAIDRSHLTMNISLMKSYVERLVYICHKRGTFAMGGMSAAIPIKNDTIKNKNAMTKVEQDKLREVQAGHDGTWVAHPALVTIAKNVFDKHMMTSNQIDSNLGLIGSKVQELDLLQLPSVPYGEGITSIGLRKGVAIVVAYTEAWLRGVGCIPLNNAMEDAATAEISRAQIWQWQVHGVRTQDDDTLITKERIRNLVRDEVERRKQQQQQQYQQYGKWDLAGKLVAEMLTKDELDDFLTTVCYPHILSTTDEGNVISSRL